MQTSLAWSTALELTGKDHDFVPMRFKVEDRGTRNYVEYNVKDIENE
jgi:hypothetical protein